MTIPFPEIVTEAGRLTYWETPKGTSIENTVDAIFLAMAKALIKHDEAEKIRLRDPANWPEKKKALHREIFATVGVPLESSMIDHQLN